MAMAGIEAERHRDKIRRLKATQRASYAKSGVTMEGSPLEVLADTQAQADLDEMIIRHGGKFLPMPIKWKECLHVEQEEVQRQQDI